MCALLKQDKKWRHIRWPPVFIGIAISSVAIAKVCRFLQLPVNGGEFGYLHFNRKLSLKCFVTEFDYRVFFFLNICIFWSRNKGEEWFVETKHARMWTLNLAKCPCTCDIHAFFSFLITVYSKSQHVNTFGK